MIPITDDIDWAFVDELRAPSPPPQSVLDEQEMKAEKRRKQDRERFQRQHDRMSAQHHEWYEANKEYMREYHRRYAKKHKAERAKASREWHERFKAEHGISYSAYRRRILKEQQQ